MKHLFLLILLILLYPLFGEEPQSVSITINIDGLRNDSGICRLLVFDNKDGFPDNPANALHILNSKIEGKKVNINITLEPGIYAFSVLHDENENGKMDKTWFGKPTEGFGVSNNPRIRTKAPSFEESAVKIEGEDETFQVVMVYL